MEKILLIILLGLIIGNEEFDQLLAEKVSEEYCSDVISNLTALLNDGYVFLDFLKAPIQPNGKEDYVIKVDLISELNKINKTDRAFYDFYVDIQNVLNKARDGHLSITVSETPNHFPLDTYHFCLPFYYTIQEIFDESKKVINKYLTIESSYCMFCTCDESMIKKTVSLRGKKILSINSLDPYEYFEEMSKKGYITHSSQGKFIDMLDNFASLSPDYYPLKKEDLQVSIKFEGMEEEFVVEYNFEEKYFFSQEFKEYYLNEKKNYFKNNIPLPKLERMELDFKIKKGLINNNHLQDDNEEEEEDNFWKFEDARKKIRCRVDEDNHFNVLYQNSFTTDEFDNYEDIMYKCFSLFYSNEYKLIIIEDRNDGGKTELCYPCAQYVRPKILKPIITTLKSTQLLKETFFLTDEMLNPETCFPYTEKDNILDGTEETYNDGSNSVKHKKTKEIDSFNIYEKKIMEKKRIEFLKTGKTKKSTEVLVFTDGAAFSCGSDFIRELQIYGYGIIVGFNSKPDLKKSDFDASQSNSGVEKFEHSNYSKNLEKLGFTPYITDTEKFDPNDKSSPKVPMEFKIYPVDEISNIYIKYEDDIYDRFIEEAKRIFDNYNDLENGKCNPDNKFLFYETEDCDKKLTINKAHGGYLCGNDGKWNTSNCIATYCEQGFILNDDRTKCIRDPCQDIELVEVPVNCTNNTEYIIEPKKAYIFSIEKENYSYYFHSKYEKFFYAFNKKHVLEAAKDKKEFKLNDKIYVNYFVNITKKTKIKISLNASDDEFDDFDEDNNKGLSGGVIALIIIGAIVAIMAFAFVIIFIKNKKQLSNSEIKDKAEKVNPILE